MTVPRPLSDGSIEGTWALDGGALALAPFRRFSPTTRRAVERAAHALLSFDAPTGPRVMRWLPSVT